MLYHLHHQGKDLGVYALDELRRRREAGTLTGAEHVWTEGMANWQPLDTVLSANVPAAMAGAPPPLPPRKKNRGQIVAVGVFIAAVALGLVFIAVVGKRAQRQAQEEAENIGIADVPPNEFVLRPIPPLTNSMTAKDAGERAREFRQWQWIEGYKARAKRDSGCDAEALRALETWLIQNYGGPSNGEAIAYGTLFDRLMLNPGCTDPLILTIAGVSATQPQEKIRRLEKALQAFENSGHLAYPKWYALLVLAAAEGQDSGREDARFAEALKALQEALRDGSIRPQDQPEILNILFNSWGERFYSRMTVPVIEAVKGSGEPFQWLALTLEGERRIGLAWKARGGQYADTVSEQAWEGFYSHLIEARAALTQAWELHPEWAYAPARMIAVSMGDSDGPEMRLWFDRALAAQMDMDVAWSNFRWGIRPRWHGSIETMLALGIAAVDTGRFDTDVPRKIIDVMSDMEADLGVKRDRHIYGRPDIWPHLRRMYEGYISYSTETNVKNSWRAPYAAVAYLAGQYETARAQLEALQWQAEGYYGWGADMSLIKEETAARAGPLGLRITEAEQKRERGALAGAISTLKDAAASPAADERTRAFIAQELAAVEMEASLKPGEWVDFMPANGEAKGWNFVAGTVRRAPDGALEVEAPRGGHMFYSRARMGENFEIRGEFEAVASQSGEFQAGLVIGVPEMQNADWLSFRMKRNASEGDMASFAKGWSRTQAANPAQLNAGRNTFEFRLQHGRATATVNGTEVLTYVPPGRSDWTFGEETYAGFGAYTEQEKAVVRYYNIQARLIPETRRGKK